MKKLENPMYLHCKKCITAERPVSYEICTDGRYVQVWCQVCDCEVTTLELKPRTP